MALYLTATALLVSDVRTGRTRSGRAWLPVALALALHAWVHVQDWCSDGVLDLHFFASLSLTGLCMALLTAAYAALGRMPALGVIVYPLAALCLLGYGLHQSDATTTPSDWRLQLHAWCALLAYATLAIAALLAVLLWLQERALRRREFHRWLRILPPLTELETVLFRTIAVGFVLLTATLLTGALFVHDLFAQHLAHKTVLSILSWLVFGILLFGRWRYGWRGRTAAAMVLGAMLFLFLAFFGSQFVYDFVLKRG